MSTARVLHIGVWAVLVLTWNGFQMRTRRCTYVHTPLAHKTWGPFTTCVNLRHPGCDTGVTEGGVGKLDNAKGDRSFATRCLFCLLSS